MHRKIRKYRLLPYDIGGKGDCFFKPIPHQLYGTLELLYQICMPGIRHLNDRLEFYVESISNISWELIMSVKVLELL